MLKWGVACLALISSGAVAQEVADCDWQARADAIVEPWDENSASFANGAVRLALMDTVEPAAGAFHLLVLSPPYDEIGARQCRTIGLGGGMGFSGADFGTLSAQYDAEIGLIFALEAAYLEDGVDFVSTTLIFTLNQATGAIEAFLE